MLTKEDVFTYISKPIEEGFKPTKRILKKMAILFDPLGLLSSFVIRTKLFKQVMWITGTDWNDQLSDDLVRKVNSWFSKLN